jgi:transcriptional/translational regulatory protein YebC/TACO1
MNSYLRTVIDQALSKNMPMSTIEKNIKKFNSNDSKLTRHFFEIKSMGRVFLIVEFYTENIAGLKQNLNTVIRKTGNNTSLAEIKHSFQEIGFVQVTATNSKVANASEFEDELTEHAIECDAQEVENIDFDGKTATFICRPIDIEKVKRILLNFKYVVEDSQHIFVPNSVLKLNEDEMKTYESLKLKLNQLEGFENIYDNVEIDETTASM